MFLKNYIEYERILRTEFASKLGISMTQLMQYLEYGTIPRKEMIWKICVLTEGQVDANDLNGITKEKIEAEILKRGKIIWNRY